MSHRDLQEITLSELLTEPKLDLQGANLSWSNLKEAGLYGVDLSNANLREADLTGAELFQANLQGADLVGANLQNTNLKQANLQCAILWRANLQRADLSSTNLNSANLLHADLKQANLEHADIQDANLFGVNLEDADFFRPVLTHNTNLEDVSWHNGYILPAEKRGQLNAAQSTYRALKTWHQEHGFYDIAGEFHYREMVCRRKGNQQDFTSSLQKTRNPWRLLKSLFRARWTSLATALVLAFYEQLFGYGERPWRVVRAAVIVVVGLMLTYYIWGTFAKPINWLDALYYSAVSFSALGYGSWAPEPLGWAKYMGVVESFLGVFTIALFLVTFTRKMVR